METSPVHINDYRSVLFHSVSMSDIKPKVSYITTRSVSKGVHQFNKDRQGHIFTDDPLDGGR